jgi:hypothetical protein
MLSLLKGYRARRSRSTSLLDGVGRFTKRRLAALDERFRLLTSAATAFQRFLQPVRMILYPSPVSGSGCAARKGVAKRTQMMDASKTEKHRFSEGMRTFRFQSSLRENHVFAKRTQIEKIESLHQQTAKQ